MSLTQSQDVERRKEATNGDEDLQDSSRKSSNEVQDLQKQGVKPADPSLNVAQSTIDSEIDKDRPFELVDNSEKPQLKGLELDPNGELKKYTDSLGETYIKHDGKWHRHGLLSPEGEPVEDVKLDKDGNLNIIYRVPKDDANPNSEIDLVTKQIRPDGTEKTIYPNSQTLTSRESDGTRVVTVLRGEDSETGGCKSPLQTVKFAIVDEKKPPQCVYFQDAQYNTYEMDRETGKWTKKDAAGNVDENWKGTVTAESDGCAVVFNDNLADTDRASFRYFPDGTVVNAKDSKNRTLTLTDGTTIQNSAGNAIAPTLLTTTRPDGSITRVEFDRDGHPTQVTYTKDGDTKTYHRKERNDISGRTIRLKDPVWYDQDGQQVNIDDKTVLTAPNGKQVNLAQKDVAGQFTSAGNNPIEYRPLVQEVPENYETLLRTRFEECRNYPGDVNMYYKTRDGGDWDDKKVGRQYEAWGNAAWGMYANEMGYEFDQANAKVGLYKIGTGKSRVEWVFSKTNGQNPHDYELTRRGYELREKQRQLSPDQPLKSSQDVDLPDIPAAEENWNIKYRNAKRESWVPVFKALAS